MRSDTHLLLPELRLHPLYALALARSLVTNACHRLSLQVADVRVACGVGGGCPFGLLHALVVSPLRDKLHCIQRHARHCGDGIGDLSREGSLDLLHRVFLLRIKGRVRRVNLGPQFVAGRRLERRRNHRVLVVIVAHRGGPRRRLVHHPDAASVLRGAQPRRAQPQEPAAQAVAVGAGRAGRL